MQQQHQHSDNVLKPATACLCFAHGMKSLEVIIWENQSQLRNSFEVDRLGLPDFTWLIVRMIDSFGKNEIYPNTGSVLLQKPKHLKFQQRHSQWWTLLKLQRTLAIVFLSNSNGSQNAQFLKLVPMSTMRIHRLRSFSSDQFCFLQSPNSIPDVRRENFHQRAPSVFCLAWCQEFE